MAKLYFRYGPMAAGKSALLLQAAHNYTTSGMKVLLLTSGLDNRSGTGVIASRIGIQQDAKIIEHGHVGLEYLQSVYDEMKDPQKVVDAILVDECQFLSSKAIDILSDIVDTCGVPVLCYGIRTDFKGTLFEGSTRLFEIADSIEELKHICSCGKKATMNARLVQSTEKVLVGGDDVYKSMCRKCFKKHNEE